MRRPHLEVLVRLNAAIDLLTVVHCFIAADVFFGSYGLLLLSHHERFHGQALGKVDRIDDPELFLAVVDEAALRGLQLLRSLLIANAGMHEHIVDWIDIVASVGQVARLSLQHRVIISLFSIRIEECVEALRFLVGLVPAFLVSRKDLVQF